MMYEVVITETVRVTYMLKVDAGSKSEAKEFALEDKSHFNIVRDEAIDQTVTVAICRE